jgi:hypothetical protein
MSNTDPTKNRGWTQALAIGKHFLSLIVHPPFYSYSQCVLATTIRKETNNIDKILALLKYNWE